MNQIKKIVSFLLISAVFLGSLTFIVYRDDGTQEDYKLGIGIYADVTALDAAFDEGKNEYKAGKALTEYTFAALVIDKNGRVVDCELDASTNGDVSVSENGAASVDKNITTKVTLGEDYGMNWYEQADNFEKAVKGKTLEQIKNLVLTSGADAGKGTEEIMNAGCTIYVSQFIFAIEKAFSNTKDVKLSKADVSLGISVSVSQTSADADNKGSATFTGVATAAVKEGNKVVSCITDESEVKLSITKDGKLEGKADSYKSKRELGYDYGMALYAKTDEWYVQVDALDKACEGKNSDQIAALMNTADKYGYAVEVAGCTIYAGNLIKAASDAAK